jgi:hypothetical protein
MSSGEADFIRIKCHCTSFLVHMKRSWHSTRREVEPISIIIQDLNDARAWETASPNHSAQVDGQLWEESELCVLVVYSSDKRLSAGNYVKDFLRDNCWVLCSVFQILGVVEPIWTIWTLGRFWLESTLFWHSFVEPYHCRRVEFVLSTFRCSIMFWYNTRKRGPQRKQIEGPYLRQLFV